MTLALEAHESLSRVPEAVPLLLRASADLMERGWSPQQVTLHYTHRAVVARCEGIVVGAIAWDVMEFRREASVVLSAVDPGHRRRGVYQALHARLVEEAQREGLHCISSGVHPGNEPMLRAAARAGRAYIEAVFLTMRIPPSTEG